MRVIQDYRRVLAAEAGIECHRVGKGQRVPIRGGSTVSIRLLVRQLALDVRRAVHSSVREDETTAF